MNVQIHMNLMHMTRSNHLVCDYCGKGFNHQVWILKLQYEII